MAATTLALLCGKHNGDDADFDIHVLTKLGNDLNGQVMLDFYKNAGAKTDLCFQDPNVSTAMSVLPVFKEGGRACFFNLASNNSFTTKELLQQMEKLPATSETKAFLFGYPHLLPQMQGDKLKQMLLTIRSKFGPSILLGVDLNGVTIENHRSDLLGPALEQVDILHLNEEEAELLSGFRKDDLLHHSGEKLQIVTEVLHKEGCAVVVLSLGSRGSYISVTSDANRLGKCPSNISNNWKASSTARIPAFAVNAGDVNANGAGDALFAAFCFAAATMEGATLEQIGTFASLVARQRCDVKTRDAPQYDAKKIMEIVRKGDLPERII